MTQVKACGGIVRKIEGQNQFILLIRKKNSTLWTLPKGHLENNESDQITALREVKEETGYICNIEKKAGEIQYQYHKDGQNFLEKVIYFVMVPLKDTNNYDTEEIEEIRWVKIEEARNLLFYNNEKEIVQNLIKENTKKIAIEKGG